MTTFAPSYEAVVPDFYTPLHIENDEEIRRQLEVEILEQWFNSDSDDIPPDFDDEPESIDAHSVGGVQQAWEPASVAQRMALECPADIILYGGKAGVYKSETLLVNASIEVENPNYNAIIFRQSFPELRDLVKKSIRLYSRLGGKFTKGSPLCWTFPSGATIWLGYMGHDDDVFAHQGAEYSFIGFDEAGHQTESRIRYMLTRLRSTDPTLRLRMFLTANPGGPGHAFLMHTFLKGACPHCEQARAVKSGHLYYDATWKSDNQKLSMRLPNGRTIQRSVAFIWGKLEDGDKDLLGDEYTANLMTQASATAKMLMDGCWKAWEGQFFDCFMETRGCDQNGHRLPDGPDMRMVVPIEELRDLIQWWYPHMVSGDYGFSISAASGHLLVRTPPETHFPRGRVYVLDEYMEPGKTAKEYVRELLARWFLDYKGEVPEKARSIQMWVLSPDAYRKDGSTNDQDVPFSRIEQMNEILAPYGFAFMRANDDRPGGWMMLYQMLRDGELVIARHCKNTIEMFQTRLKDPKKFDDLLKVKGDPLDDIADGLRYGIMTWPLQAQKPKQERIAEAVQGLTPTNAMLTVLKIEHEERGAEHSVSFSPKARRRGVW